MLSSSLVDQAGSDSHSPLEHAQRMGANGVQALPATSMNKHLQTASCPHSKTKMHSRDVLGTHLPD